MQLLIMPMVFFVRCVIKALRLLKKAHKQRRSYFYVLQDLKKIKKYISKYEVTVFQTEIYIIEDENLKKLTRNFK